jgi:signal transduction histidine kinase
MAPALPGGWNPPAAAPERSGDEATRSPRVRVPAGVAGSRRSAKSRLDAELEREKARRRQLESELRRARRDLEVFAYSVAHDLRTPLQAVAGFTGLLLEDRRLQLDAEASDLLARIARAGARMQGVIDQILAFACPKRIALERRVVDLSELAREVARHLELSRPERKVEWVIEEGVLSACDVELIREVMTNLLGNAWKYTEPVARARVEFGVAEQNGVRSFFVRDNGVGFDADDEEGFLPVARFDLKADLDGVGIGLPTVKRILELHGGSIAAQSAGGCGATFYFTVGSPIARRADQWGPP